MTQEKPITPRELEILLLIERGLTNSYIANQLGISTYTVETHRKNLNNKLGTKNPVQLINEARKKGII